MTNDERLARFLSHCQKLYERMKRDGTWPWSQPPQDHHDTTED